MNQHSPHRDAGPEDRKSKIAGVAATVVFHALLLGVLVFAALEFTPGEEKERRWPPVKDEELLYGGEYVMVGEPIASAKPDAVNAPDASAEMSESTEEQPEGTDTQDSGEPVAQTAPVVTQDKPSPVKEKKEPESKPAGPTQAEIEEQERIKRQEETSRRINDRVAFGSGSGNPSAAGGSPDGNAAKGAMNGAPGTDLAGRTLASWSKPKGDATGTITVAVSVDRKGKVISARYASGTGAVAGSSAARRSCEQAAMKSSFSVSDNAPATQKGTITYRFE